MEERNEEIDADLRLLDELADEGATDIVGPTGEEMPLATHDQGHGWCVSGKPRHVFDRLESSRQRWKGCE